MSAGRPGRTCRDGSAPARVADVGRARTRALQPDKIGARDSRRALTFAQWNERASRLANALLGLGLVKGDRVALLAYNCVEWMELYVALARPGWSRCRSTSAWSPPEIEYIVAQLRGARVHRAGRPASTASSRSAPSSAIAAGAFVHFGAARAPTGWHGYEALIARGAAARARASTSRPRTPWALMYTSGTTGRPKGAIRNHAGQRADLAGHGARHGLHARRHRAARDADVPRELALLQRSPSPISARPASSTTASSFDPEALLRTLAEQHVTFTSLVPTHYIMMLGLPRGGEGAATTCAACAS